MTREAEMLRSVVEQCLNDDPTMRPSIEIICETIQETKDAYTEGSLLECIVQLKQQSLKMSS